MEAMLTVLATLWVTMLDKLADTRCQVFPDVIVRHGANEIAVSHVLPPLCTPHQSPSAKPSGTSVRAVLRSGHRPTAVQAAQR